MTQEQRNKIIAEAEDCKKQLFIMYDNPFLENKQRFLDNSVTYQWHRSRMKTLIDVMKILEIPVDDYTFVHYT